MTALARFVVVYNCHCCTLLPSAHPTPVCVISDCFRPSRVGSRAPICTCCCVLERHCPGPRHTLCKNVPSSPPARAGSALEPKEAAFAVAQTAHKASQEAASGVHSIRQVSTPLAVLCTPATYSMRHMHACTFDRACMLSGDLCYMHARCSALQQPLNPGRVLQCINAAAAQQNCALVSALYMLPLIRSVDLSLFPVTSMFRYGVGIAAGISVVGWIKRRIKQLPVVGLLASPFLSKCYVPGDVTVQ